MEITKRFRPLREWIRETEAAQRCPLLRGNQVCGKVDAAGVEIIKKGDVGKIKLMILLQTSCDFAHKDRWFRKNFAKIPHLYLSCFASYSFGWWEIMFEYEFTTTKELQTQNLSNLYILAKEIFGVKDNSNITFTIY